MIAESYGKSRLSCAKNCQTIFLSGHFALPLTMRRVPIPFTFQDVMTYYFENAHIVLFWGLFCFVLFFWKTYLFQSAFIAAFFLISYHLFRSLHIPLRTQHSQYVSIEVPLLPTVWYRPQFSLCILKQSFLFDSILLCRNQVELWN